ncbi:hypothetical protein AB0B31_14885 [Catellatospora citrea]|uniref:hypothetical protein n=1 Tax=Catellatospora citrea TaxID=53366 RepID=UPI0033D9C02A
MHDLGDGWQRVGVSAFYSERPRIAQGVADLVAATGAPAIAAYVSESSCAHLEGRTPSGVTFTLHLPNADEACGYEHLDGRPRSSPHDSAFEAVMAWAAEAGRQPEVDAVAEILDPGWSRRTIMEKVIIDWFGALGFSSVGMIEPTVDPDDPAFDGYEEVAFDADCKASAQWRAAERGRPLHASRELTERERDYLAFRDLLWGSVYGGGLTQQECVEQFASMCARWA